MNAKQNIETAASATLTAANMLLTDFQLGSDLLQLIDELEKIGRRLHNLAQNCESLSHPTCTTCCRPIALGEKFCSLRCMGEHYE